MIISLMALAFAVAALALGVHDGDSLLVALGAIQLYLAALCADPRKDES